MSAQKRCAIAAIIFCVFALVEAVAAWRAHSVSVLADATHNFADALALGAAVIAWRLATRRQPSVTMHFGYHRLEVASALANGAVLFLVALGVAIEAIVHLRHPEMPAVHEALPIVVASTVVNVAVAFWVRPSNDDVSHRAAYLHVLSDAAWSAAVVVALIAVARTGRAWIDPLCALLVAVPVMWAALRVIAGSGGILLQKSHVDPLAVAAAIREIDGVEGVADVRVWHACSYLVVGTAHVITSARNLADTAPIATNIRAVLRERFGVGVVTIEFESPEASARHAHDLDEAHEWTHHAHGGGHA